MSFFVTRQATAGPKKKAAPPREPQSYVMHRQLTGNACFVSVNLAPPAFIERRAPVLTT
jgi:hypothetical protein